MIAAPASVPALVPLPWLLAGLLAGLVAGGMYFLALRRTVRQLVRGRRTPLALMLGSRIALACGLLAAAVLAGPQPMLAGGIGIWLARRAVTSMPWLNPGPNLGPNPGPNPGPSR